MAELPTPRRTPGRRAGLGREQVLEAARALLAEKGSAGLTMRALAARLGVAPNTLYSHVADKTQLVDLVLDDVLGGVPLPAAGTAEADPVGAVRAVMLASYDVLVTHADLMPHFLARQGARGERAVRLGEVTLDALERAGVAGRQGRDALRVLIVNTIGFAAFSAGGGVLPAAEVRATHERALDWLLAGITAG
jgi:TetR/AcrR family transcriptional regulator, tetracycline repressor protein